MNELTVESLVEAVRAETGLDSADNDSWREGLELLLHDHAKTGLLNEMGHAWRRQLFTTSLRNRFQVDDYIRRNPEVIQTPVKRPVFILGMPRTGTTMTSYLLASDPARRSLLKWEASNVAPPAAPGALRTDPRCLAELERDKVALKNNPAQAAKHYEAGDGPTECVFLTAQDFRSLVLLVMSSSPTYSDWLLFCDMSAAYEHRKRVFQILQSTNPGLWTLKMPSDSIFIRHLFRTFPDAKVIWTHRDPYVALSSIFSMRGASRELNNRDPDAAHMRQYWPLQLAFHVQRPMEMSRERPGDIYNLYYRDLVADPIAQMRKIYRWLGDDYTPAAEAGMRSWLEANPQGRFGVHSYSLEKWGLTKADLEPYFGDYLKAHPVEELVGA
jgi:hypothetical protein